MAQANDASDLFVKLESNDLKSVQEIKRIIHENLSETAKETWLLNGLVEYYFSTNSVRCLDILSAIQAPHDKHLFDKIADCLKSATTRMQALSLLGHIVRKQPLWLHKIANHPLLGALLKLLKTENDAPTLLNALLVLVTLLPIIPALISPHLTSIFDIFSRVAAWNTNKPANVPDIFILHLQVGVYALFHRLYGMYPCNFLSYLRTYYSNREHLHTFSETIRPMLERVRMHPLLVTASKEAEISTTRWKKMETHDIIMECAKVSLDVIEGTREEAPSQHSYLNQTLHCQQNAAGEGFALDINPKGSVKKESKLVGILKLNKGSALSQLLQDSSLTSSTLSPSQICVSTPPPIQIPSDISTSDVSAMRSPRLFTDSPRIDSSSVFKFPVAQYSQQTPIKIGSDQNENYSTQTSRKSILKSHGSEAGSTIQSLSSDPVKVKSEEIEVSLKAQDSDIDQEVSEIVASIASGSQMKSCERTSFVASGEEPSEEQEKLYRRSDSVIHDDAEGVHTTELEESSDTSMGRVMDFVCSRIRYHSQCGPPPDLPEWQNGDNNLTRARSCPEITDSALVSALEEGVVQPMSSSSSSSVESTKFIKNGTDDKCDGNLNSTTNSAALSNKPVFLSEHLLTSALPIIAFSSCHQCTYCQERNSTYFSLSPPEILDRHYLLGNIIHAQATKAPSFSKESSWALTGSITGDEIGILRGQVLLLHNQLLFERHRREIHAERNRRLLAKLKKARALEEHNAAMNDQLRKQEKYISDLKEEHAQFLQQFYHLRQEKESEWQKLTSEIRKIQQDNEQLKYEKKELLNQLSEQKCENQALEEKLQDTDAELLNANLELQGTKSKIAENIKLREEVERLNKQLILMGELQQKYREKFSAMSFPSFKEKEKDLLTVSYKNEIQGYKQLIDSRNQMLDTFKARVTDLENQIAQKEQAMNNQKNLIRTIKEQYQEQIQAIKEKNHGLNSQILILITRILNEEDKLRQASDSIMGGGDISELPSELQKILQKARDASSEDMDEGEGLSNLECLSDCPDLEARISYISGLDSIEPGSPSQDVDSDTSDYIKRRLNFSHLSRRGSSSIIGSASFSMFSTAEVKTRDGNNQDVTEKSKKDPAKKEIGRNIDL